MNYENIIYLDLSAIDKLNLKDHNSQNIPFENFTKLTTLKIPYYSLYNEKLVKLTNLTELYITPHNITNFETLELRDSRGIFAVSKLTNLRKLTIENNEYFKDFSIFHKNLDVITINNCNNLTIYKSYNSNHTELDKL